MDGPTNTPVGALRRSLGLAGIALLLCACSPDKGFGETIEVTADDYGSAWPLTVDTALLNKVCGEGDTGVAVVVQGKTFVIDQLDSPDDAPAAFLRFWAEDPSQSGVRKDLSPLVAGGRSLCE